MPPKVFPTAISLSSLVRPLSETSPSGPDSPQAGEQLAQATIGERWTDDQVGRGEAVGRQVDQRQQERRQRETTETKRSRITELAVIGRPVQAGLELSTERWQTSRVAGVYVCERVAAIVVRLALCGTGVLRVVDPMRTVLLVVNLTRVLLLRRHGCDVSAVNGCPDHGWVETRRPRRLERGMKTGGRKKGTAHPGVKQALDSTIYLPIELIYPREER